MSQPDGDGQQPLLMSLCTIGLAAFLFYAWWIFAGKPCPPDWAEIPDFRRGNTGSPTLVEE